ncbi:hypothetical protein CFR78_04265 [Komagataeibacter rhaeticus]|uniref:phage head morphogenesis protein n=1 Tax=Komagataeibacter rhaeticus TaxID=215221 RepID=UPI0004D4B1EF|nr:phage minor head protein [Komagataeibacter rhaeticus]KDU96464.1 hypothetical protein GLUCORHAEAF1_01735 [Komagataeibacter rhaeticus AF1]PYD54190.1 hypothetical protein CFR78_04265 [Komagataeibacter rhaeticus]GBQ15227.1 phage Mu protein F-like protein [Komagataeibacter rhaeticus DSM 16663]
MADTAVSAAKLPPRDALAFLRQKVPVSAATWTDLWHEAHDVSFAVAGATSKAIAKDFQDAVIRTMEAGGTRREFQKEFDAIVKRYGWEHTGTPGWRASIIYDTNITTAYSAGRYRRMTTPESLALYPYWRYRHHTCQHPRPQHLAWDGMILRADDPFWNTHYPPNGWRCHCTVEVVSQRMLDRNGWQVSSSPVIETRPWRNPHTGEIVHVPIGIDPGFAYNPGKAWLMNEGARVVTEPTPKLRPMLPPAQDAGPARPVPARPAAAAMVPEPPGVAPLPAPVAPEPVPDVPKREQAQQDAIVRLRHRPVGTVEAGEIPAHVQNALGGGSRTVHMSGQTMEKQLERHPDLTDDDYRMVPQVLANPAVVAASRARHVMLLSHAGRLYRAIVKVTGDGKENWLQSFHRTNAVEGRRAIAKLLLISGSMDDLENDAPGGPPGNPP